MDYTEEVTQRGSYLNRINLERFWEKAKGCMLPEHRFDLLVEMTRLRVAVHEMTVKGRRSHYQRRRQRGWLAKATRKPCWVCLNPSRHRHHVIPIECGGRNIKKNIVPLCVLCHRGVHGGKQVGFVR